jgi:hypothetical protein
MERRCRGRPEDEMRAQVLPESLEVVVPDRVVDPELREYDVTPGPDRGAKLESAPHLRPAS